MNDIKEKHTHPILEINEISKTYRDTVVIQNINVRINACEIVCIVGESGSGKTTILQIAGLLDTPTSGSIFIDGKNCTNLSQNEKAIMRRKMCGFVYQFHHLSNDFSVLENVMLPALICGNSIKDSMKEAKIALNKVNISDNKHDMHPINLSGGEQQRVAIARAIVNSPKIVFADEPTGDLDHKNTENILSLIKDTKEAGASILIVTHDDAIVNIADRVFVVSGGTLV